MLQTEAYSEVDATLRRCAERIVALKLETPALFFLEAHKPLTTIVQNASIFFAPVATPFFGAERIRGLQEILASRTNIDRLMELIEHQSAAQKMPVKDRQDP